MEIIVLGPGCAKCKTLEKMVQEKVVELGIDASVKKEEDIMKIMSYGIMSTPGIVINGKVAMSGRLPSDKELTSLLTQK